MTTKHPEFKTKKELFDYMDSIGVIDPMKMFPDWETYRKFRQGCVARGEIPALCSFEEFSKMCAGE